MTVPQIVMDGDSPRARLTDPVTSHEAADSTAGSVKESQSWVFTLLDHFGPLADHELVEHSINTWSPSRIRTARHELVELGAVTDAGFYRFTPAGRRAKVWQVPE